MSSNFKSAPQETQPNNVANNYRRKSQPDY